MAVKLAFNEFPQQVDADGAPISGGLLFTYVAGSSTKSTTYQDSAGNTSNTNPIVFDASGRPPYPIWLTTGISYKFVFAPADDTDPPQSPIWTLDAVTGINDTETEADQWVAGPAPTYVSATSFTLVGDQTSDFQVGRRLKTTNSGGTVYSRISASAYTTSTAVTVVNDSGTLDAGLSAVFYGLLTPTDPSTPVALDTYPVVSGSSDRTKLVRIEADGLTTATTRVITMPDKDVTLADATDSAGGLIELATQAEVNAGTDATRAVTSVTMQTGKMVTQATVTLSGGGAAVNISTTIPSWVNDFIVTFVGVSTNGTSDIVFQGSDGSFQTATYSGSSSSVGASTATYNAATAGFACIENVSAAVTYTGAIRFTRHGTGNTWEASGTYGGGRSGMFGSSRAFSAALTGIRIASANATDTFDGGTASIAW